MRTIKSTIGAKLILALLGCGVLLILATATIRFYYDYNREMRLLNARVHEVEQSNISALENSIWLADWEMVRVQAEGIQRLQEIRRVEVVADGRVIAAFGGLVADTAPRQTFPLVHWYNNREISLGTLTLYTDEDAVRLRLLGSVIVTLGIQMVTILIISSVLFFLFHRLAGRHLIAITRQLRVFGQEQMETPLVLDKKPAGSGGLDEIDQVVASFNEMRHNLHRSFEELRQANEKLVRENQERVKADAALRESETRYSLLVNAIPEVFWMVSADFKQVLFISPAYEQIWDRSCEKLKAEPNGWLAAIEAEDRPGIAAVIDSIGKGQVEQIDFPQYRIRRPDDTLRWIKSKGVPLRDETGKVWGVAGLSEDISKRLLAEEEKTRLEFQLRQAQKMEAIGTLAGGIAHDFNNILSIIFGYNELAIMETDPEKRLLHLKELKKGATRARELVAQILAFSRKAELRKQPLQVSLIVKEALKMLRASIPATIEIRQEIVSDGIILADPSQIHQIVMNLCTNAYQAMRETGGTLAVSLRETKIGAGEYGYANLNPGNYLKLEVSDTGCGIDPKIQGKIFDPYFTTKKQGEGTGMGLAVVHGIVKSHHGHITVYSEPGKGTCFNVYLPLSEQNGAAILPDRTEPKKCPGKGERILFVDDEEQIRAVVETILTHNGYKVTTCADGVRALAEFKKKPDQFDLVITDMTMPAMTGAELAQKIMSLSPRTPVILCTGQSELINREKALAMGVRDYLNKPVLMETLLGAARKALDSGNSPLDYRQGA